MNFQDSRTLMYCRARSYPIFDSADHFLGTGSAISPDCILTCNHCVISHEQVVTTEINLEVVSRMPCIDVALLETSNATELRYFVVSSSEAQMGESVIVYGYRVRDGSVSDVVMLTEVGSISERQLSPGCAPQQVVGLGTRSLVEAGMSGGVVLRAATLEMIGFVVGYDHPKSEERKDDVFVAISAAITENDILRKRLTFEHRRRATRVNLARRLLSLSGFAIDVQRLGDEPGLDECLLCSRGDGVLRNVVLAVFATSEQMCDTTRVTQLYDLSKLRASSRGIHADRVIVVVGDDIALEKPLDFTITVESLRRSTPGISEGELSTGGSGLAGLIAGQFLQRSVIRSIGDQPAPAVEVIESEIEKGTRLIALTGPVSSGKATVIANFHRKTEAKMLAGHLQAPATYEISLLADLKDKLPHGQGADAGTVVVSVTGFDELWASGDAVKALRQLRVVASELKKRFLDWTILLPVSGGLEQTQKILSLPIAQMEEVTKWAVFELLPFSPEVVRDALLLELGGTQGRSSWKTVTSSQEIFQIAQWPSGLSVLLDRVVQASWAPHRAKQVHVIAALVNGFLGRTSKNADGLPPSATSTFLIALAEEMNATQRLQIPIDRARKIYANIAPHAHNVHMIAAADVLVRGLVSQSVSPESVGFESPIFLHYLLAVAIQKSVESGELGSTNPLYHRRIPVALLTDVMELGLDEQQLWKLIRATAGKAPEAVGYIGGNSISLLRLLGADLRNSNFANCDLRGGIFAGCDLSGADFSGSVLIDVGLANCTLHKTNFADSNLDRADLKSGCTVYQLATQAPFAYVATSSRRLVRIDRADGGQMTFSDVDGFSDTVFAVAVSKLEGLVVAGGQDGTIRGWTYSNGEPRFILRGHFSDVRSLAFAEGRIVSGSVDGQINIWTPSSTRLAHSYCLCGGEIWSLEMVDADSAVVLCDRSHVHVISVSDGTQAAVYNLPTGCARRLTLDRSAKRVFVGGPNLIWMLDVSSRTPRVVEVTHPFVRTVLHMNADGFLLGGAHGIIYWMSEDFSTWREIKRDGKDYISDLKTYENGRVMGGDAGGRVFLLERGLLGWTETGLGILDPGAALRASGSDFRRARNVPDERRSRLAAAGALV